MVFASELYAWSFNARPISKSFHIYKHARKFCTVCDQYAKMVAGTRIAQMSTFFASNVYWTEKKFYWNKTKRQCNIWLWLSIVNIYKPELTLNVYQVEKVNIKKKEKYFFFCFVRKRGRERERKRKKEKYKNNFDMSSYIIIIQINVS